LVCLAAGTSRAEKLLAGYSSISGYRPHLWIANETGLLKKYGVDQGCHDRAAGHCGKSESSDR
jgi:hypothetical protein